MLRHTLFASILSLCIVSAALAEGGTASFNQLIGAGNRHVQAGDYAAALEAYTQASEMAGSDAEKYVIAITSVARAHRLLKQYEEAHASLAAGLKHEVSTFVRALLLMELGVVFEIEGKLDDAIAQYTKVREMHDIPVPIKVGAEMSCGRANHTLKNYIEAESHFKAVAENPDAPQVHKVDSVLWLGWTSMAMGESNSAQAHFQAVLDDPLAAPEQKKKARDSLDQITQ